MNAVQQVPNASVAGATQSSARTASALVIDDSQLCRQMVCKALTGNGFTAASASDGQDALAQLQKSPVDVILLDNEMPKMSGLAFLKALRAETKWDGVKVIMLTTTAAKEVIVEALRYRISDYLLKEKFSMPEMLNRVRTALTRPEPVQTPAPAPEAPKPPAVKQKISVPNFVPRDAALAAIADFSALKTLGGIVSQLNAVASSERTGMTDVTEIVRQDPVLAARIVQLASSPAYASSKARIASVDAAVRAVGVKAVCELAASVAVFRAFPADCADGLNLLRCWQHAFAVAAVMKEIVPKSETIPSGLPHLIGLCHDLAEICLRQKFPSEFGAAVDFAKQADVPVSELIGGAFGATYAELTQAIMTKIPFSPLVSEAITEFVRQPDSTIDAYDGLLARSLAVSHYIANGMLLAASSDCSVAPASLGDCRSVLIPTSPINVSEIRFEAMTTACILANLGPEAEGPLMQPLLPTLDVSICYVRHSSFAPLDPIETALNNLCTATTFEHLSKPDDLAEMDGIVIVAPPSDRTLLSEALRVRDNAKKDLPILHLAATIDRSVEQTSMPGVTEATYPVTLNSLAQFVSTLKAKH